MLQNATFTTFIYYLLENTQQCKLPLSNYMGPLSMEMVKQTAVQPVSTGKFALHKKNRAIKRGLGRKNRAGKKSQRIRDEKRAMCAWDHWNSIGANPARYRCEFATSKTPRIRAVCVMALTLNPSLLPGCVDLPALSNYGLDDTPAEPLVW